MSKNRVTLNRGIAENHSVEKMGQNDYDNGIYFSTDKPIIYVGDVEYNCEKKVGDLTDLQGEIKPLTTGDSIDQSLLNIYKIIDDNELVISSAFNDHEKKLLDINNKLTVMDESYGSSITDLKQELIDDEEVIAKSLNILEDKKQNKLIDGETIKTVNGKSILGEGNIEISGGSGSEEIYIGTDEAPDDVKIIINPDEDLIEITDTPGNSNNKILSQAAVDQYYMRKNQTTLPIYHIDITTLEGGYGRIDFLNEDESAVVRINGYYDDVNKTPIFALDDADYSQPIIRGVECPIQGNDAANKDYVDTLVGDVENLLKTI